MIDYILLFLGVLLAFPGVTISKEYYIHHQCRNIGGCPKYRHFWCENGATIHVEWSRIGHSTQWPSTPPYGSTCNVTNDSCYKEVQEPANICNGLSSCTINGCSNYIHQVLFCIYTLGTNYVRINYTCISASTSTIPIPANESALSESASHSDAETFSSEHSTPTNSNGDFTLMNSDNDHSSEAEKTSMESTAPPSDAVPLNIIIIVAVVAVIIIIIIIIIVLGVILSKKRKKRKSNKKDIEDNDKSSVQGVTNNNHAVKGEYGTILVDNTDYVTSDDVITADIIAETNRGKSKINSTIGSDFVENTGYAGYGNDVDSGLTRMKTVSSNPRRPVTLYPVLDITDGTDIVDNEGYIGADDAPKLVTQVSVKLDKPAATLPGGVISDVRVSGSDNYADIDLDATHPGIQPENDYDEIGADGNDDRDDVNIIDTSMDPDYELAGAILVDPEFTPAKPRLELTKSDYEDYELNSDSGSPDVDATSPYTNTDGELFSSQKPIKPPKPTSPKPMYNQDGSNIDKNAPQFQTSPNETLSRQTGPLGDDYTMVIKSTD